LENNQIPSVYLWYGEDRYVLAEALRRLKEVFLAEDPSGSNITIFRGKDSAPEDVVEAANTASFFSRRLVIVDDIPYFHQSKTKDKAKENSPDPGEPESDHYGEESLLAYLENLNPDSCLVLISEKVNRGRKLYKAISKSGKVVEFAYPQGQPEWLSWIQKETRARGKQMSPAAASFLLEFAGHHTGILSQELDKLALFTGAKTEIGKEDISKVCISLAETTVFAMLDAIAAGKTGDALLKLKEVLSQEYYLKVHTMIVRQVRLLLAACLLRKQGATVERLVEVAGIKPFEGNKVYRQAGSFNPQRLAEAMEDCLKTELALKSSGGDPHFLLEMMVIRLCRK
jgi:DNA polymerase-3 subunit delta